jgi:hypothetical protein
MATGWGLGLGLGFQRCITSAKSSHFYFYIPFRVTSTVHARICFRSPRSFFHFYLPPSMHHITTPPFIPPGLQSSYKPGTPL